MTEVEGSRSGSVSQRHGSTYQDLDPHQKCHGSATLPSGLGQGAQGARQGRDGGQADHPGARQGAGQALEGARQTGKVVLQGRQAVVCPVLRIHDIKDPEPSGYRRQKNIRIRIRNTGSVNHCRWVSRVAVKVHFLLGLYRRMG
jgi:hypothetical protein